jgi:hypothetical protein
MSADFALALAALSQVRFVRSSGHLSGLQRKSGFRPFSALPLEIQMSASGPKPTVVRGAADFQFEPKLI